MAGPIRVERVRSKIKNDVAEILQREIKDPRMGFVTVMRVELSTDLRHAKVFVSILAEREGEVRRVLRMLEDARGYVQSQVAKRLNTRVTPELQFVLDTSSERSVKISSVLDELRREREEREARGQGLEHSALESEESEADEADEDEDDEDEDD